MSRKNYFKHIIVTAFGKPVRHPPHLSKALQRNVSRQRFIIEKAYFLNGFIIQYRFCTDFQSQNVAVILAFITFVFF